MGRAASPFAAAVAATANRQMRRTFPGGPNLIIYDQPKMVMLRT